MRHDGYEADRDRYGEALESIRDSALTLDQAVEWAAAALSRSGLSPYVDPGAAALHGRQRDR